MDRFACYLPGWEIPKNSSDFLTNDYGFITDYLAEAFHYTFQHTNRYEEVTRRVRLGPAIEGRDEKGIKKTVAAFLKILHPLTPPTDAEFEEYVAYAVEQRRRVKEQMNKRKPDDEFAKIDLSYIDTQDKEIIVFCPESKDAIATQNPARVAIAEETQAQPTNKAGANKPQKSSKSQSVATTPVPETPPSPKEQHYTIHYGDTGYSYDSIFGPYLAEAKKVIIEEPIYAGATRFKILYAFVKLLSKPEQSKRFT